MSRQLGSYAFFLLTFASYFVLVVFLIKTKWQRSATGRNLVSLAACLVGISSVVILQLLGALTAEAAEWLRTICYLLIAIVLLWRGILILKYNWHFWAWTKEDKDA